MRTETNVLAAHLLGMPASRATEQGVKIWPVLRRNCAHNPSSKYVAVLGCHVMTRMPFPFRNVEKSCQTFSPYMKKWTVSFAYAEEQVFQVLSFIRNYLNGVFRIVSLGFRSNLRFKQTKLAVI